MLYIFGYFIIGILVYFWSKLRIKTLADIGDYQAESVWKNWSTDPCLDFLMLLLISTCWVLVIAAMIIHDIDERGP